MGSQSQETDACSPATVISPRHYCLFHCLLPLRNWNRQMYCERRRSLSGLTFFWQINVKVCFHVVEGNLPVSNNIMWRLETGECTGADLVWITIRKWCWYLVFSTTPRWAFLFHPPTAPIKTVNFMRKNAENEGPNSDAGTIWLATKSSPLFNWFFILSCQLGVR